MPWRRSLSSSTEDLRRKRRTTKPESLFSGHPAVQRQRCSVQSSVAFHYPRAYVECCLATAFHAVLLLLVGVAQSAVSSGASREVVEALVCVPGVLFTGALGPGETSPAPDAMSSASVNGGALISSWLPLLWPAGPVRRLSGRGSGRDPPMPRLLSRAGVWVAPVSIRVTAVGACGHLAPLQKPLEVPDRHQLLRDRQVAASPGLALMR